MGIFMELIILKGKPGHGKTTTLMLLHNKLVSENSKFEWIVQMRSRRVDVEKPQDFISVYDFMGGRIAIISSGDEAHYVEKAMSNVIANHHPDIIIVCMHTRNYPNSSNRMLHEKYRDLLKKENIFDTVYTSDKSNKIEVKYPLVEIIYQHIVKIIKTIDHENKN